MEYNLVKTFSSGVEAGGDDIERKKFMEEHYELNMLDLFSYPDKIFDTPEKAGLALHCMRKIMKNDPAYLGQDEDGNDRAFLKNLVTDIEVFSASQSPEVQKKFLQNIVTVMGHIIEVEEEEERIVFQAMEILQDIGTHPDLNSFTLDIHKKKYKTALAAYDLKMAS